ncbi:hypothetical protein Tco_1076580 [Tanacetum coccineum]
MIRSLKIVMENPNHLNEPNEAIPEVNPVDPKTDIEENRGDVDIELEDDAELIFPYEVEGDKTPPPGDVSSDSGQWRGDWMLPEASFLARDHYVVGLHLGLRQRFGDEKERELLNHDLENVERALGNVLERVVIIAREELIESRVRSLRCLLGYGSYWGVLEVAIDDEEMRIMPPKAMSEARMREVIREQVATSMDEFMANINRKDSGDGAGGARAGGAGAGGAGAGGAGAGGAEAGGAGACDARANGVGPATPKITGCTYVKFMKCDPQPFKGTKGSMGLCQWFEKLESVFRISDCKERDKVKFATATLQGRALTWLEQELYNLKLKGTDIDGYTNRFHELALLCPRMVEPEQVKVEQYIRGLLKNIRGDVT